MTRFYVTILNRCLQRAAVFSLPLLFSGCFMSPYFRWPSLAQGPAGSSSSRFELHDPFADERAGPHTESRPASFQQPHTDERKALERRMILATARPQPVLSPGTVPPNPLQPMGPSFANPYAPWDPLSPNMRRWLPPLFRPMPTQPGPVAIQPLDIYSPTGPAFHMVRRETRKPIFLMSAWPSSQLPTQIQDEQPLENAAGRFWLD